MYVRYLAEYCCKFIIFYFKPKVVSYIDEQEFANKLQQLEDENREVSRTVTYGSCAFMMAAPKL
jgi:hypothetical protein